VNDTAQVFRFGGDAFAVLWPNLEKEQAFLRLESFREAFDGVAQATGGNKSAQTRVTASAGLASYPDDGLKAPDIESKAAEALYRAKVTGRGKTCLAREENMVTKTSHYTQGQLMGLRRLAEREGIGEAVLLREGLNDLLRKYNA
jgi:predicted signal transduction protein with EAL and GGDEF domain